MHFNLKLYALYFIVSVVLHRKEYIHNSSSRSISTIHPVRGMIQSYVPQVILIGYILLSLLVALGTIKFAIQTMRECNMWNLFFS